MEREIEFRIRYSDKSWFYGVPLTKIKKDTVAFQSFDGNYYDLFADATTLGQYTGLKDKHGNKIYEGDIVKHKYYKSIVRYGRIGYDSGVGLVGFSLQDIHYDGELSEMEFDSDAKEQFFSCDRCIDLTRLEVIGNIYDNKELLD